MYQSCFVCGVIDNDHILKDEKVFCHECIDKDQKGIKK